MNLFKKAKRLQNKENNIILETRQLEEHNAHITAQEQVFIP